MAAAPDEVGGAAADAGDPAGVVAVDRPSVGRVQPRRRGAGVWVWAAAEGAAGAGRGRRGRRTFEAEATEVLP